MYDADTSKHRLSVLDLTRFSSRLASKGVDAVSSHGGKAQVEREAAMKDFKFGRADVLIATDVAAKGLDFPDVQHVINFDMPKEIETYVHRVRRHAAPALFC